MRFPRNLTVAALAITLGATIGAGAMLAINGTDDSSPAAVLEWFAAREITLAFVPTPLAQHLLELHQPVRGSGWEGPLVPQFSHPVRTVSPEMLSTTRIPPSSGSSTR
jgi:hypothetical protein